MVTYGKGAGKLMLCRLMPRRQNEKNGKHASQNMNTVSKLLIIIIHTSNGLRRNKTKAKKNN